MTNPSAILFSHLSFLTPYPSTRSASISQRCGLRLARYGGGVSHCGVPPTGNAYDMQKFRRVNCSVRGTRNGLRRLASAVSGNYVCNARTYLNIVTHNKGTARIGVKMYGDGFQFLGHSFVRLSTKIVILPLGELLKNGKSSKYAGIILSEFMTGREQNLTEYSILLHGILTVRTIGQSISH